MTQYEVINNRLVELRIKASKNSTIIAQIESQITDDTKHDDLVIARKRIQHLRTDTNQIENLIQLNEKLLMVSDEHEYQLEN